MCLRTQASLPFDEVCFWEDFVFPSLPCQRFSWLNRSDRTFRNNGIRKCSGLSRLSRFRWGKASNWSCLEDRYLRCVSSIPESPRYSSLSALHRPFWVLLSMAFTNCCFPSLLLRKPDLQPLFCQNFSGWLLLECVRNAFHSLLSSHVGLFGYSITKILFHTWK